MRKVSVTQMYNAIVESQDIAPQGCKYNSLSEAIKAQKDAYPDHNFYSIFYYVKKIRDGYYDTSMFKQQK